LGRKPARDARGGERESNCSTAGRRACPTSLKVLWVDDDGLAAAELLKVRLRSVEQELAPPPPWRGIPPPLAVYRERGHRRLAARTYPQKCASCMWGCWMAVEMIIDQ